jgi:hypothetical protein
MCSAATLCSFLLALSTACHLKTGISSPSASGGGDPAGLAPRASSTGDEGTTSEDPSAPLVPEPSPPAYMDEDGVAHGPGGPVSDAPRDCSAANNHCLRGNGWLVASYDTTIGDVRVPAFELDGTWYSWDGDRLESLPRRTRPATIESVMKARDVYVFLEPRTGKATVESGCKCGHVRRG